MSFFVCQSRNGLLDKSSHLFFPFFFFGDADILLLSKSDYSRETMYDNSNKHAQHHAYTISIRTNQNITIAHNEPCDEECCRDPCYMILCLKLCCSVQNLSPVLGTQNLIHCQEGVPYSAERHFIFIPELIESRNVTPHQLTGKDPDKEGNHEQEHYQVQDTVDVAEDFFLRCRFLVRGDRYQ